MGSEWVEYTLGEVVDLVIDNRGRNPNSYADSGIPVIDNYLIVSDGEPDLSKVRRYIDEVTYSSFIRKYNQNCDVLVTLVGNGYGQVAISPKEKCIIIQNTIGLRCREGFDNTFLYYLLKDNRDRLMNLNRGAAQPSIKVGDLLDLRFHFPNHGTQRKIGSYLVDFDRKKSLNRQTNQTLENLAQALFKSWFVDFDPVIDNALAAGNPIPPALESRATARAAVQAAAPNAPLAESYHHLFPSEFEHTGQNVGIEGWVPKGWDSGRVDSILELVYGKALKKTDRVEGDTPVYGSGGINGYHNMHLVEGPSIIVGRKGTVGSLYWEDDKFYPIDTVFYVKVKNGFTLEYCYQLLQTFGLENMNTDAAVPGLNRNNVYRLKFPKPNMELIKLFSKIVGSYQNKKVALSINSDHLEKLRDTLLPKLISGELRIPASKSTSNTQ